MNHITPMVSETAWIMFKIIFLILPLIEVMVDCQESRGSELIKMKKMS